jgi:thiol-disulfide isomerase/thioredoxin
MVPILVALALLLAAPSAASAAPKTRHAPPIVSDTWLNSTPIAPRDLDGRVVLVEFWTFGCGNCQATVPAMERLWPDYRERGLVMIGVHTPETDYERIPGNVRRAIARQGISFPVALDPEYKNWKAFHNRYWPAIYLVDARGEITFEHIGELHVGTADWKNLTREIDRLLKETRREGR